MKHATSILMTFPYAGRFLNAAECTRTRAMGIT
jgi:hypothetical protein